jgi:threonine aldolase
MLNFESDYVEGAHEALLEKLLLTNREQLSGYGVDKYTASAKEKIRAACGDPLADVFFLVGGTQTNRTVISSMLPPYAGVISAVTGHIEVHEAGAIEASGHKVLPLPHADGKLSAETVRAYLETFYADPTHEHMVAPGMVYVSHPTEYGTLYTKSELSALSALCREYGIPLYLDGARLGYGLSSDGTDLSLPEIARLCDAFYIGGTKVGALCGEAVVFPREGAPKGFFTSIKQNGALLAKGRLLGVQFDALFTDDLYFEISRHAISMANALRLGLSEKGYRFHLETTTNQIFLVLGEAEYAALSEKVAVSFWERLDEGKLVVRLATSWATTREQVEELLSLL